ELGLPALTPQPPWHGYSLGDWDAAWDVYAGRAVSGQWEDTGKETFARRRGGLTPETPVKSVKEGSLLPPPRSGGGGPGEAGGGGRGPHRLRKRRGRAPLPARCARHLP